MSWPGDISLLRPIWLLAIPCIIVMGVILRRRMAQVGSWDDVVDPELMQAMRAMGRVRQDGAKRLANLPLWTAGLIAICLTGPAVERRDAQSFRNLDGVVFVVDVSSSAITGPLWPSLVTMGRIGVASLGSKPAAMIVYAGDAYVASAMTSDTGQIGLTMTLLDDKTVPDIGSRPALALAEAARILTDAQIVAGDVVVLTDGAGFGPEALTAAKTIADQGARLSVVHTGDPTAALETLVSLGSGRMYSPEDGDAFADDLASDATARMERQDYLLLFWSDYGRYVLVLALIPLLGLFRRAAP